MVGRFLPFLIFFLQFLGKVRLGCQPVACTEIRHRGVKPTLCIIFNDALYENYCRYKLLIYYFLDLKPDYHVLK